MPRVGGQAPLHAAVGMGQNAGEHVLAGVAPVATARVFSWRLHGDATRGRRHDLSGVLDGQSRGKPQLHAVWDGPGGGPPSGPQPAQPSFNPFEPTPPPFGGPSSGQPAAPPYGQPSGQPSGAPQGPSGYGYQSGQQPPAHPYAGGYSSDQQPAAPPTY